MNNNNNNKKDAEKSVCCMSLWQMYANDVRTESVQKKQAKHVKMPQILILIKIFTVFIHTL